MPKEERAEKVEKIFSPEDVDLKEELDKLLLRAGEYENMAPYFSYLAKQFGKPIANLRSRYNYLRRRVNAPVARPEHRGRPRRIGLGPEGDVVRVFAEVFRVKPSREAIVILRECVARHGVLRVAMAMERVRPEGGEIFARAIATELGRK